MNELTGNSMNKMDGISKPAKVNKGPIESVLAVGPMIHSDDYVTATPSLHRLPLKLWDRRQLHFSPAVNFFVFLHHLQ